MIFGLVFYSWEEREKENSPAVFNHTMWDVRGMLSFLNMSKTRAYQFILFYIEQIIICCRSYALKIKMYKDVKLWTRGSFNEENLKFPK